MVTILSHGSSTSTGPWESMDGRTEGQPRPD
jgi:hypothetical protein